MSKTLFVVAALVLSVFVSLSLSQTYFEKDIEAYHFHTYIFDVNPRHVDEALTFRRAMREKINDGTFAECSLNEIIVGWDGPHPYSQFELFCNKTSFPTANAWHMQNHGNLSILVHPLTTEDLEDHVSRVSWIGQPVPLDTECPCLYPVLPKPRPCPVYPEYPDEMPTTRGPNYPKIPGTEDYSNTMGLNLLVDKY